VVKFLIALALIFALPALPTLAQEKPADNMQILREKVKADKNSWSRPIWN
jgi:hypothetical protein